MKYRIMKFATQPTFEGKEIEVTKITSKNGNKSAIELILELSKKFDNFVIDQNKRWEKQEAFNKKQEAFNKKQDKRWEKQEKHNAETDKKIEYILDVLKRNNLK